MDFANSRLELGEIGILQQGSKDFDRATQSSDEAYKHSMRSKDQKAADAIRERDKFINDTIEKARRAAQMCHRNEAFRLMSEAAHPIMDASSPMHVMPMVSLERGIRRGPSGTVQTII